MDAIKKRVVKKYPLSLHALIASGDPHLWEAELEKKIDPVITFRPENSRVPVSVVRTIRVAEALLERGQYDLAATLLRTVIPHLWNTQGNTQISFQLYVSLLFQRARDLASSFQILALILRQDPSFLSRTFLELLYPREQFNQVKQSAQGWDPYLILSLVRQESAFDPNAKSSAGALGLMQLQLPTARNYEKISLKQLWQPEVNLRVGIKYLSRLEKRFNGRLDQALAAYNAGPERIRRWTKQYPIENPLLFLDTLPVQETRDYVSSIARNYYWYKRLYSTSDETSESGQKLLRLLGVPGA
jgi:hypothetical protein